MKQYTRDTRHSNMNAKVGRLWRRARISSRARNILVQVRKKRRGNEEKSDMTVIEILAVTVFYLFLIYIFS